MIIGKKVLNDLYSDIFQIQCSGRAKPGHRFEPANARHHGRSCQRPAAAADSHTEGRRR